MPLPQASALLTAEQQAIVEVAKINALRDRTLLQTLSAHTQLTAMIYNNPNATPDALFAVYGKNGGKVLDEFVKLGEAVNVLAPATIPDEKITPPGLAKNPDGTVAIDKAASAAVAAELSAKIG